MTQLPRRTMDDLRARYELEPTLRDVYVEGAFDRDVLTEAFIASKQRDRAVYVIDSVDIDPATLLRHGLTEGNKNRVIALAREMVTCVSGNSVRYLVDRDLDHWFGDLEKCRGLLWTEHSSVELYFFTEEFLNSLLVTVGAIKCTDWKKLLASIERMLVERFAARLADRELALSLRWLSATTLLAHENDVVAVDWAAFVERLLNASGKSAHRDEFERRRQRWLAKLTCDSRQCIHGHDLVEVLAWVIRELNGHKEFGSQVAVERSFLLLVPRIRGLTELLN